MSINQTAREFFEACDGGQGWSVCKQWCHDDATFSAQADALADIKTLEAYADWAKGLMGPLPDAHAELRSLASDEDHGKVTVAAVFHGTHTGDAGTGAPTGKSVSTDYAYVMDFDAGKIRHVTKIWNDGHALRQLGWA